MTTPILTDKIKNKFQPFLDEILAGSRDKIDSVYITGSALTADFEPKRSDINSVVVLKKMDLGFLEHLAPLGKQYGKKNISAPLIMTPEYILTSLDVFPMELLNIKLLHYALYGEDRFQEVEIRPSHLRAQCERELKVRLIGLRQGYLSSMGDPKILTDNFIQSISGYIPLFRAIIFLLRKEPPILNREVMITLQEVSGVDLKPFRLVLEEKKQRLKLGKEHLDTLFEANYRAVEQLGDIIDGLTD